MTRDDLDVLWNRALQESVKAGEQFTRYHFADLVLSAKREALADQPALQQAYEQANPLGGPAKVFDAMANAIRSGNSYPAVLREYGYAEAAQPQQGPVGYAVRTVGGKKWHSIHASKGSSDRWLEYRVKEQAQGEAYEQLALYTSPPAQCKPLTDEQIKTMWRCSKIYGTNQEKALALARAIEAAHGIKGDRK